jgi:hypothetical protein
VDLDRPELTGVDGAAPVPDHRRVELRRGQDAHRGRGLLHRLLEARRVEQAEDVVDRRAHEPFGVGAHPSAVQRDAQPHRRDLARQLVGPAELGVQVFDQREHQQRRVGLVGKNDHDAVAAVLVVAVVEGESRRVEGRLHGGVEAQVQMFLNAIPAGPLAEPDDVADENAAKSGRARVLDCGIWLHGLLLPVGVRCHNSLPLTAAAAREAVTSLLFGSSGLEFCAD